MENEDSKRRQEFFLAEHKIFTVMMLDIDKLIAQLYGGTVAVSVAFLGATASYVMADHPLTWQFAYAFLLPNLLLLPSFSYLLALRRDLVGAAAYVRVLEQRIGAAGYQTGLEKLRKNRKGESNDPIPWTYWGLVTAFCAVFLYVLFNTNAP